MWTNDAGFIVLITSKINVHIGPFLGGDVDKYL